MTARQHFRLVGDLVTDDTLETFERLAEQARQRLLVGSIIIPLYRGKKYFPITTGWATDNETFTAGILSVCTMLINERAITQSIALPSDPMGA